MVNDEIDGRYSPVKQLTVKVTYESGKVEQYSFPEIIVSDEAIVSGEWVDLPDKFTDEECEWVYNELGPKMRHLGSE